MRDCADHIYQSYISGIKYLPIGQLKSADQYVTGVELLQIPISLMSEFILKTLAHIITPASRVILGSADVNCS